MSLISWALSNWSVFATIGVCTAGLGIGGILTLSNTGEGSSTYLFRSVPDDVKPQGGDWINAMDGKDFHDAPIVSHPYYKLLKGDSSYNSGNYIIYYGSMACIHCTEFLFNDQSIARGKTSPSQYKMSNGTWMRAFQFSKQDNELSKKNIKFLMYDDRPDQEMVNKDDKYWTLPWSSDTTSNTYTRNDRSAREIRTIIDTAKKILGNEKVPGTPAIIVYKKGVPKVFGQDTLKGLEDDPKQESVSDQPKFVRFIKHYFTYVEQ